MKNDCQKIGRKSEKPLLNYLILIICVLPTFLFSQQYRTIKAYIDDFEKNEMFVKKSLIDYSQTLVESQLETRSSVTSGRIIEKLKNINTILISTNKGFEKNTLLKDSFIKMNEKTIACLTNGSLILNDYDKQSLLSLEEIKLNVAKKESEIKSYFEELRNYEINKRIFASQFGVNLKPYNENNTVEYNAYQNIIFYKLNIIDQKLISLIKEKDKVGFAACMKTLEMYHQETYARVSELKSFNDSSLSNANIEYSNFIFSQKGKLTLLFNDFVAEYNALQKLKSSSAPETKESVALYNTTVRNYNNKKNYFFTLLDDIQKSKKVLYDNWYVVNSKFLKNNTEFENIHDRLITNDD